MNHSRFEIAAECHVSLPEGRWEIACESGLLWVTQEGDLRDHVLRAGESACFRGRAIVMGALQDSRVRLTPDDAGRRREIAAWRVRGRLLMWRLWLRPASLAIAERRIAHVDPRVCPDVCHKLD